MALTMDGRKVLPQPGQSLLELVKQLGLDASALTKRPLAAKRSGGRPPVHAPGNGGVQRRNPPAPLRRPGGQGVLYPHGAVHDFPCHAAAVAGGNGKNDLHAGFQRVHQRCGGKGFFRFDPESAGQ